VKHVIASETNDLEGVGTKKFKEVCYCGIEWQCAQFGKYVQLIQEHQ